MRIIKKPQTLTKKIKLSSFSGGLNLKADENLTPINYATNCYNFAFKSGALKEGLGVSDLVTRLYGQNATQTKNALNGKSVIACYYAKKFDQVNMINLDKLVLVFDDYSVSYLPLNLSEVTSTNMLKDLNSVHFTSKPIAINYRLNSDDVTILSSLTDSMAVWPTSSSVYTVLDAPQISSMCIHYERLFATVDGEQTSVWFSDDLDPTNWSLSLTEAGFIDMPDERGALKKVISFNDAVYIFRNYGIAKITAYGDQTQFNVSQLFVSSGKIYPETVVLCGDIVLFLATDGLYRFDGLNCTRILDSITPGLIGEDNQNACGCYFENKYYLACNFKFADEQEAEANFVNNCLIEVDLKTMSTSFMRGVDITSLSSVNSDYFSGVVACVKTSSESNYHLAQITKDGKFFGQAAQKVWESPLTDLGYPEKRKCLKELVVTSSTDLKITLTNEEQESKSFEVKGNNHSIKIPMRFEFSKIKFKIINQTQTCNITDPYILLKMSEVMV